MCESNFTVDCDVNKPISTVKLVSNDILVTFMLKLLTYQLKWVGNFITRY